MTILILYVLAMTALIVSLAFIPLILVTAIPLQAVYYHSLFRVPVVWGLFISSILLTIWANSQSGNFLWGQGIPLALAGFAVFLTHNFYPKYAFRAVDHPKMSSKPLDLPIDDQAQMAVIEHGGVTKAYPLDYLIHGHIINDQFGDRLISLTYCALCRSVIPFDVTDIGPLYVGAMKNGNLVLADKRTGTFFQQGTFSSLVGPLHPMTLDMVFYQSLTWRQVKALDELPQVCCVSPHDFRPFALPIPGAWEVLTKGDLTPGLAATIRDKTFPARTKVIGITDPSVDPKIVYIKDEVVKVGVVKNKEQNLVLVAQEGAVNAYRASVCDAPINLAIGEGTDLVDRSSGSIWDVRGKFKEGPLNANLDMVMMSDEYWYSWKLFHPNSELIRL